MSDQELLTLGEAVLDATQLTTNLCSLTLRKAALKIATDVLDKVKDGYVLIIANKTLDNFTSMGNRVKVCITINALRHYAPDYLAAFRQNGSRKNIEIKPLETVNTFKVSIGVHNLDGGSLSITTKHRILDAKLVKDHKPSEQFFGNSNGFHLDDTLKLAKAIEEINVFDTAYLKRKFAE